MAGVISSVIRVRACASFGALAFALFLGHPSQGLAQHAYGKAAPKDSKARHSMGESPVRIVRRSANLNLIQPAADCR